MANSKLPVGVVGCREIVSGQVRIDQPSRKIPSLNSARTLEIAAPIDNSPIEQRRNGFAGVMPAPGTGVSYCPIPPRRSPRGIHDAKP